MLIRESVLIQPKEGHEEELILFFESNKEYIVSSQFPITKSFKVVVSWLEYEKHTLRGDLESKKDLIDYFSYVKEKFEPIENEIFDRNTIKED